MTGIILHIGAHKCATTSLQSLMRARAKADPTVLYGDSSAPDEDQRRLYRAVEEGAGERERQEIAETLLRLAERAPAGGRLILSNENFLGRMIGLNWGFYPNAGLLRDIVERIARRMPTRILLQSREPASYLKSAYGFRVRYGLRLSYEQFLQNCRLDSLSWQGLGDTLFADAAFGWHVLPIETLKGAEAAGALARCAAFLHPGWTFAPGDLARENPARGALVISATLQLNKMGCPPPVALRAAFETAMAALEAPLLERIRTGAAPAPFLQQALRDCGIQLGLNPCRAIIHDCLFASETPGHLDALLTAHFAGDYARFLSAYAGEREPVYG